MKKVTLHPSLGSIHENLKIIVEMSNNLEKIVLKTAQIFSFDILSIFEGKSSQQLLTVAARNSVINLKSNEYHLEYSFLEAILSKGVVESQNWQRFSSNYFWILKSDLEKKGLWNMNLSLEENEARLETTCQDIVTGTKEFITCGVMGSLPLLKLEYVELWANCNFAEKELPVFERQENV